MGELHQRHLRRPEARPQAQGRHPRRQLRQGPARGRDASSCKDGRETRRSRTSRWISTRWPPAASMAGSGGVIVMDDIARHGLGAQQHQRVLRPRDLRPVHALPRRLALDEEDHRPHRRGRRHRPRIRTTLEERRRQHRRPHHLRLRRSLLLADAKFRREVPRGIRRASRTKPRRRRCRRNTPRTN